MLSKSSKILNKRHERLGLGTPHNKRKERVAPTQKTKEKTNMNNIRKTSLSHKQRRTMERRRKTLGSGVNSIRDSGITLLISTQIIHWW
jgi:hypothetical protein